MFSVVNEATPFTAATVSVPPSVPVDGFVPMATVMELLAEVTTLPKASSTLTVTAGEMKLPAVTLVGWTVKASLFAAPTVTLNAMLVAPVRLVALADRVYPVPVLLMFNVENETTPFTAATVSVPPSVPLDGFVPIAMVIEFVAVVTTLPRESSTLTVTAGEIALPAVTFVGWTVNASLFAAPAVTLKAVLVAPVKVAALAAR